MAAKRERTTIAAAVAADAAGIAAAVRPKAMRQFGNVSPTGVSDLLAILDVVQRHVEECAPQEQAA